MNVDLTFGTPVNLGPMLNEYWNEYTPCILADGLELHFSSSGQYGLVDLLLSRRGSVDENWGPAEKLGLNMNSSRPDYAPSTTADELLLFFLRYDELPVTSRTVGRH